MKNWQIYTLIIVTYIVMHVSSVVFSFPISFYFLGKDGLTEHEIQSNTIAWSLFIANALAAIAFYFLLRKRKNFFKVFKGKIASPFMTFLWGVLAFILALVGQMVAAVIEMSLFGIEPGSENTEMLSQVALSSPVIIICIVFFAPLLEEIVFRRVLFGGIYQKSNFFIAALVSGFLFAIVHGEIQHTIVYMAPAIAFAFVYYKTNRILAPMIGHFLMNTYVVIIQLNYDKIMEWEEMYQIILPFFH